MTKPFHQTLSEAELAEQLNALSFAWVTSRCLHVTADLGVADWIDTAPETATYLAEKVGADPDALGRILRLLSRYGVFEERAQGFVHSPLSRFLRSDHPHSQRPWVSQAGAEVVEKMFRHLDYSVATGASAADKLDPPGFFAYLAANPRDTAIFNAGMTSKSRGDIAAILRAYDFSPFATIGDIGGGHGHLIAAILAAEARCKGVLFDQPQMVDQVAGMASDRLQLIGGDFFSDPLPACDCYTLMSVIHDWDDARSVAILKAVRKTAPRGARLLLIELLLPEESGSPYALLMDVCMLAITGGRERKLSEYEHLLTASGWRFDSVTRTDVSIAIVESVAA